jgi:hypothetical protein
MFCDFDIMRAVFLPRKTDSVLIVNPDAPLPLAITRQRLQPITWRNPQIEYLYGVVQSEQAASRDGFYVDELRDRLPVEQAFTHRTRERPNHLLQLIGLYIVRQAYYECFT